MIMADETFAKLCAVIADELDADPAIFTRDTTAEDVDGWDSISHASVVMAVERAFSVRFSDEEIYEFANVGAMHDRVRALIASA
jgi:acyl carrier protein